MIIRKGEGGKKDKKKEDEHEGGMERIRHI